MNDVNFNGRNSRVSTTGDFSPALVQGDFIVGSSSEDALKTDVKFDKLKNSWITSRKFGIISWISTVVSAACAVISVFFPTPIWEVFNGLKSESFPTFLGAVSAGILQVVSNRWAILLLTILWILVTVLCIRYWWRRHMNVPEISRYPMLKRSLIPQGGRAGEFARARVLAQCKECKDENRPNEYGSLKTLGRGKNKGTFYSCRYKHRSAFRERSLFVY